MRTTASVDKYLALHAEPEARSIAETLEGEWKSVVTIPLSSELEGVPALVASLERAAQRSGPALGIFVVNARDEAPVEDIARSEACLKTLAALPIRALTRHVVDRASPGRRFPHDQGVGLARKLGSDLALALWREGRVASNFFWTTDGDATVSEDYFTPPERGAAAATLQYSHQGDDPAHTLYEISLRYYVDGLGWAGSPYAFPTIGSTLAIRFESYAEVRGFPRRLAAEDFYILAKLAKVGPIVPSRAHVSLTPRPSQRVPFGTGAACARIERLFAQNGEYRLYPPRAFALLRALMAAVERSLRDTAPETALADLLPLEIGDWWPNLLAQIRLKEALVTACRTRPRVADRLRHFHAWFDALKTLRFIHEVRDRAYPMPPWREALARAPFVELDGKGSPIEILGDWRERHGVRPLNPPRRS